MRVLRSSLYSHPSEPPAIVVVMDGESSDTLESAALQAIDRVEGNGLVLNDIFEIRDDANQPAVIAKAAARSYKFGKREEAQVLLYFWVAHQWRIVKTSGVLVSDRPAPLTADEIREVLVQLARRSDYRDITYSIPAEDGTIVTLSHGKVS